MISLRVAEDPSPALRAPSPRWRGARGSRRGTVIPGKRTEVLHSTFHRASLAFPESRKAFRRRVGRRSWLLPWPGLCEHLAVELDVAVDDDVQGEFLVDPSAGGGAELLGLSWVFAGARTGFETRRPRLGFGRGVRLCRLRSSRCCRRFRRLHREARWPSPRGASCSFPRPRWAARTCRRLAGSRQGCRRRR